jgi:hypothetical protein
MPKRITVAYAKDKILDLLKELTEDMADDDALDLLTELGDAIETLQDKMDAGEDDEEEIEVDDLEGEGEDE